MNHLFWDSCVFIRFLIGDESADHFSDIARFIGDAKAKRRTIYFSTLTLAEMRQEFFQGTGYGGVQEFFEDLGASFVPIEPNPNVMIASGVLRSAKSTNPGDPNPPAQRTIATPDAIILTTCLFAKDQLGIEDVVFQTTDEGKGKNWYGRSVPIIGLERWYPETTRTEMVQRVCSLTRERPIHPEPTLEGIVSLDEYRNPRRGA
jgi:hypothetical protein